MIFDPFGDFERRGYLRNKPGLHNLTAVKEYEHRAFLDRLGEAVEHLQHAEPHPRSVRSAVHYALRLGSDRAYMAEHPGEVMGYLAHAHPFLDGNGRTLMVVH